MPLSGTIPTVTAAHVPPGRIAVKLEVEDKDLFLAAGAVGNGAVYTDSLGMIHIIRKVIMRVEPSSTG